LTLSFDLIIRVGIKLVVDLLIHFEIKND